MTYRSLKSLRRRAASGRPEARRTRPWVTAEATKPSGERARAAELGARAVMRVANLTACALACGCASSPRSAPAGSPPGAVATPIAAPRIAPAPSPFAQLRTSIDSMVAAPQFRNAHWGILIVDPARGDTLYSRNAGKLFMPASNMKILTSAVALAQLGADFRFRTTFVASGHVAKGILAGDLVVNGRGDPSISDHMRGDAMSVMRDVADSLRAHGVRRIQGRIVTGADVFPDQIYGAGWAWDDFNDAYSAGVDELIFNEGFAKVIVHAGARPGARPTVTVGPARAYPAIRMLAWTVPPLDSMARASHVRPPALIATRDSSTGTVVLTGALAAGMVDTLELSYPSPRDAYLAALRQALTERGIGIGGRSSRSARPADCDTLFTYLSPTLREILPPLMKPSQNQIAELLLRTLGLERTGVGMADSGARVVERQLLAWGVPPDAFIVRDGSGLSRYNYVTPEAIVRVLAAVRADTAFAAYYDAMPIAGVDGTIATRMRGTPAQGNVHAKTGFIANARSLSGYVTTADHRVLIFTILCNNWTASRRDVERVQDAIAQRLASLTSDPAPR